MLFLLCFSRPLGDVESFVRSQGDLSVSAAKFFVGSSYMDHLASVEPFDGLAGCFSLLAMMS